MPAARLDPRVDAYIAKAAEFARPILIELRSRMHANVPGVTETLKWSMPHFEYKGKVFAGMAAFKQHCTFGFWHPLMRELGSDEAMGQFGCIESLKGLPSKGEFTKLARKAMKLTDEGVKAPPRARAARKSLRVPPDLAAALKRNKAAARTFEEFAYSHRKEYIEWIEEAKTGVTRERRLAQTLELLAEGKSRHWKYARAKT